MRDQRTLLAIFKRHENCTDERYRVHFTTKPQKKTSRKKFTYRKMFTKKKVCVPDASFDSSRPTSNLLEHINEIIKNEFQKMESLLNIYYSSIFLRFDLRSDENRMLQRGHDSWNDFLCDGPPAGND